MVFSFLHSAQATQFTSKKIMCIKFYDCRLQRVKKIHNEFKRQKCLGFFSFHLLKAFIEAAFTTFELQRSSASYFIILNLHQRLPRIIQVIKGRRKRAWKINKQKRCIRQGKKEFKRISVAISFNCSSKDYAKKARALTEKWKYKILHIGIPSYFHFRYHHKYLRKSRVSNYFELHLYMR